MDKKIRENLEKEVSKYTLSSIALNGLLEAFKEMLNLNYKLLIDFNKEDIKIHKKQIKIDELKTIIDGYKNAESTVGDKGSKIVVYKGDPYLTLNICLQALIENQKVLLVYDEFMLGVNEVIIRVFNNLLKQYNIFNLVNKLNEYSNKSIKEVEDIYDEIVVIGDTSMYQSIDTEKKINFYPYNNIMVYCEDEELEKIQQAIYMYANENQFEIEIVYEDSIDDAINIINAEYFANIAILLTQNSESKEKFETNVKQKEIYINKNPFQKEVGKIYNYI